MFYYIIPFLVLQILALGTMAFVIRLCDHKESIFITQLIEIRCIRIMAASYCVKIVSFHHLQVKVCLFNTDHSSCHRIGIMTVDTIELHFYPVDIDYASIAFYFTKTNPVSDHFSFSLKYHLIKIWSLRIPELRFHDCKHCFMGIFPFSRFFKSTRCHCVAIHILDPDVYSFCCAAKKFCTDLYICCTSQ